MTEPVLLARDVSVVYGRGATRVGALRAVSLAVYPGELVMVMGPSGSGKTTLLQVLGGLRRPDQGTVRVSGQPIESLTEEALSRVRLTWFGFVFQAYHLCPTLRAWENVAIALELAGRRGAPIERRSRDLLDQVGLTRQAEAFPGTLSGGQKQRVAIARALAGDPAVILADEPTGALDSVSGQRIGETLRDLAHAHGRAVVMVTHDSRLVPLADHIVTLEDGRVVAAAEEGVG